MSLTLATAINFPGGRAVLATGVNNSATSWVLESGGGTALALGGATYRVLRVYEAPLSGLPEDVTAVEYIRCSAISTDTLTVARGQQGSSAQAWSAGAIVESVLTAADINDIKTLLNDIETRTVLGTAGVVASTATIGGGFGSTGVTIGATGTIQADGAATLGSTLAVTGATTLTGAVTHSSTLTQTGAATLSSSLSVAGETILSGAFRNAEAAATIASGAISTTSASLGIDTEGAASSDDLDTVAVTGATNGSWLFLRTVNSARDVVVKHAPGTTNGFRLVGAADFTLGTSNTVLACRRNTGVWCEQYRATLS